MRFKLTDSCTRVSKARLAEFEEEHEVKLPEDYRKFLQKTNGGYPAKPGVVYGPQKRFVEYFLPLLEDEEDEWGETDIEAVLVVQDGLDYTGREYGIDLVPIAYLFGGDLVCIDCAKSPPDVVEFLHDVRPGEAHQFHTIAATFTDFLDTLEASEAKGSEEEEEEPQYVMEPVQNQQRELAGVPVLVQYGPIAPEYRAEFRQMTRIDLPEAVWTFLDEYNGLIPQAPLGFDTPRGAELIQVVLAAVLTPRHLPGYPDLVNASLFGAQRIWFNDAFVCFAPGVRTGRPDVDLFRLIRCESGNWVGIDTREEHHGEVVLILVRECEIYKPAYVPIAPSFGEFLKMLRSV
jgi:hypothetical protein